jgi:hypothetical protein
MVVTRPINPSLGAVEKVLCVTLCILCESLCNNILRTYTEDTEAAQSYTEEEKVNASTFSTPPKS